MFTVTELTKTCTKCNEEKSLNNFNKAKYGKLGYSASCRNCAKIHGKYYRSLETTKETLRLYREKNKEKTYIRHKKHYEQNKIKILKRSYDHYLSNIEHKKKLCKKNERFHLENLTDSYVKLRLTTQGFLKDQITPELIELKRIMLKTKRLCQQLQN